MSARESISVDVVSDVVCPWCFIGQKRLDAALGEVGDVDVEVRWRPFQLDPTVPREGKDRLRYMLDKFGSEQRIRQIHAKVEAIGDSVGIDFAFDAIKVAPNTLDAHRVIRWAGNSGADVQNRLARRLFQLYFEQGANIGDHAVLIEAARDSGMDAAVVETLLPTDADVAGGHRRDRHRPAHGRQRRAVLPDRGQICGDGRPGKQRDRRRHPPGRRGQGARGAGEGGRLGVCGESLSRSGPFAFLPRKGAAFERLTRGARSNKLSPSATPPCSPAWPVASSPRQHPTGVSRRSASRG